MRMPAAPSPRRLTPAKRLLFAVVPLLVLLLLAEVVVRSTGIATYCPSQYESSPIWACDPVLQFKLKPSLVVNGRPLNGAGFRTHEFTPKRSSVYRVLSIGDSCTFGVVAGQSFEFVPEPYPQKLEHLIVERTGPDHAEVFNAGIPGYNSFQGAMLLRTKLRKLQPDLITVRYGWNDHFVTQGGSKAFHEPASSVGRALEEIGLHTALYPFMLRLGFEMRAWESARGEKQPVKMPSEWIPTIPVEEYQQNLRRIVGLGRDRGARVWLLTSPHAFVTNENAGREAGPNAWTAKAILGFNGIATFARLVEIHEMYNQAAREVGAELGVPVVDMAAVYREHAKEHLFTSVDVAHPTQQGHDLEAETLYAKLLADGILQKPADRLPAVTTRKAE